MDIKKQQQPQDPKLTQIQQHNDNGLSFNDQLFKMQKINTIDHNTTAKHMNQSNQQQQQQYKPKFITQFILNKLQTHRQQPWVLLNNVPQLILQIVNAYSNTNNKKYQKPNQNQQHQHYIIEGSVHFKNPQSIYIGQGALIEHGAMISGPCLIGNYCQIRKGAYIRGGAIIGDGTLVGNSSQLKNVIVMERSQIAHFNYIGDSILGIHAHFGAGAITSNYKLDGSEIKVTIDKKLLNKDGDTKQHKQHKQQNKQQKYEIIKTGRNKFGAIVGHNTQIGCNVILNPGSIIGRNSILYPLTNWRGYLGANKIVKLIQSQQIVQKR